MTDWNGIAQARNPDLAPDTVAAVAAALGSLEAAFQPLLKQLPNDIEPAVILSEFAVLGE
jgi:hypothetical protein